MRANYIRLDRYLEVKARVGASNEHFSPTEMFCMLCLGKWGHRHILWEVNHPYNMGYRKMNSYELLWVLQKQLTTLPKISSIRLDIIGS